VIAVFRKFIGEKPLMAEKTTEGTSIDWRLPLCAAFIAFGVSISIAVCQADTAFFLCLFIVGPILIILSVVALVYMLIGKSRRRRLTLLSSLAAVWVVSVFFLLFHVDVRTTARWLVWSHYYKENVLSRRAPANGEFRHVEWDGWGWGGEDTTVFLVFDPSDSLSAGASSRQAGKFDGIPCAVPAVSRLESQWYAVRFYTNESWDRCKQSDGAPKTP
jgi:hypothetical protein